MLTSKILKVYFVFFTETYVWNWGKEQKVEENPESWEK